MQFLPMSPLYIPTAFEWLVVLLGYAVLGLTGFGSALIIIPLLAWQKSMTDVVPLVLLLDVVASLMHSGLNVRSVLWKTLPGLLPGVLIGTGVGIIVIQQVETRCLMVVLGLYIIGVGFRGMFPLPSAPTSAGHVPNGFWAFSMGLVETVFGTAGPVVLAWLTRLRCEPASLRATMPAAVIGLSSLAIATTFASATAHWQGVTRQFMSLAPMALIGVGVGHFASRFLPNAELRRLIYGLLVLSGVSIASRGVKLLVQ